MYAITNRCYNERCSRTNYSHFSMLHLILSVSFLKNSPLPLLQVMNYRVLLMLFFMTPKRQCLYPSIHPSYGTTAHSQPLPSHNFCFQTVLICAVNWQLWHRRSLAAHSFPLSFHLKPGSPHWSTASKLSLHSCNGYMVERESLYMSSSGVPRNFVRGWGSTNSVEDRGQREQGSGGGRTLVRGSGGSCNFVQEISFHIVKFSQFLVL